MIMKMKMSNQPPSKNFSNELRLQKHYKYYEKLGQSL
jgi:hypothetical protein